MHQLVSCLHLQRLLHSFT